MTKLEYLPNELFLECFRYINVWDLFHSFDHMNQRFSTLIRSFPMHLNFENVPSSRMKHFLEELQTPSMKLNVHSLHLSLGRSFRPTKNFMRQFSLDEFPSLKSIALSRMESTDVSRMLAMLSTVPNLQSVILSVNDDVEVLITDDFPLAKLKRLTIPTLGGNLRIFEQTWCMRYLTLSHTQLNQMSAIFRCAPRLVELTIKHFIKESNERVNFHGASAVCLERLNMEGSISFSLIENLLQNTPNLRFFKLVSFGSEIMDADRWEQLICSSIPNLAIFQFYFTCSRGYRSSLNAGLTSNLEQFGGDFWQKQHEWLVQWKSYPSFAEVYTVPDMRHEYRFSTPNVFCGSESVDSKTTLNGVTDLVLEYDHIQGSISHYFPNVRTLRMENRVPNYDLSYSTLSKETIQSFKNILCLSNVTNLYIHDRCSLESSSAMLDLLLAAPNISTITMSKELFEDASADAQVCCALNLMIKRFNFSLKYCNDPFFRDEEFTQQFFRTFTNLEEFSCFIFSPQTLKLLIHRFSNLPKIEVTTNIDEARSNMVKVQKQYRTMLQHEFRLTDDEVHFDQLGLNRLRIRIDRNTE